MQDIINMYTERRKGEDMAKSVMFVQRLKQTMGSRKGSRERVCACMCVPARACVHMCVCAYTRKREEIKIERTRWQHLGDKMFWGYLSLMTQVWCKHLIMCKVHIPIQGANPVLQESFVSMTARRRNKTEADLPSGDCACISEVYLVQLCSVCSPELYTTMTSSVSPCRCKGSRARRTDTSSWTTPTRKAGATFTTAPTEAMSSP